MNTITINVCGLVNTGKSTIEQEIVDALRKLGFTVKWNETNDNSRKSGIEHTNRLESILEKTSITVQGVQINKDFNTSLNYRVTKKIK